MPEDPFDRRSWLLALDRASANLLFQVIGARYARGGIVLTSNKGFNDWGELMGDPILATAMLDRLLHHSHILNIRGNSYRLRDKIRTGATVNLRQPDFAGVGQFITDSPGSIERALAYFW
jgi:IstB-like ATP binding protein